MLNSRIKNKIYALISIAAIVAAAASFAATIRFFIKINNFIFSVDEKIMRDKTVLLDKENFGKIREKLGAPEAVYSPASAPSPLPPAPSEVEGTPLPVQSPEETPALGSGEE